MGNPEGPIVSSDFAKIATGKQVERGASFVGASNEVGAINEERANPREDPRVLGEPDPPSGTALSRPPYTREPKLRRVRPKKLLRASEAKVVVGARAEGLSRNEH